MNGVCEGFQVLRHMRSKDWLLFMEELLKFRLDGNTNQAKLSSDALHLVDIDGNIIRSDTHIYKEVYSVGKKNFHN